MDDLKLKKALILAGGKGTRLNEITKGLIPKPLVEVAGKPLIVRAIEVLSRYGVTDITISTGFLHEKIIDLLGDGSRYGADIKYIVEDEPLGSGGALYFLKNEHIDQLLVCPGDVVFDVDITRMFAFHRQKQALITLFSHPNTHPFDSDLIIAGEDGRVEGINKKNSERNFYYPNLVNAGIFILSGETLSYFTEKRPVNMEHDFVSAFIPGGRVFAYRSPEYVRDAGTPERLARAQKDLMNGIVGAKNLGNKQRAVFLDRDGTINVYKGLVSSPDQLELVPGAADAIRAINDSGRLAIIISNQPVIARGECTFDGMRAIFDKLETLLGDEGAFLDGIYYCPHHPDKGFPGEITELRFDCDCRKPKAGLIFRAAKDFGIDLSGSVMIGDEERDALAAKNAGIPSVIIKSDRIKGKNIPAKHFADDILSAVKYALQL